MPALSSTTVRLVLKRLGSGVLVLFGAVTLTFVAMHALPGSIEDTIIGTSSSDTARQQIRTELGLDRPLVRQYSSFIGDLVRGDLGDSFKQNRPVADVIRQNIGPTVQLAAAATGLAVLGAGVVAIVTFNRPWPRRAAMTAERLAVSTPSFWVGIILLTLFSFRWQLFPVSSSGLDGLVLPAVTLALAAGAVLSQVLRHGLTKALAEPFIVTARARGLNERQVLLRHALRHALAPTVTLAGWITGSLISGAIVVEKVFARQGLGRVTMAAIESGDLYVVTGVVLLAASIFVVVNLVVDLAYLAIDPRLRTRTSSTRRAGAGLPSLPSLPTHHDAEAVAAS